MGGGGGGGYFVALNGQPHSGYVNYHCYEVAKEEFEFQPYLYHHKCQIHNRVVPDGQILISKHFYAPGSNDQGHIVFVLSVCLSVLSTLTFAINFEP